MEMKIQKGIVKYKDRNDIVCTYGVCDDGRQYYFLDENDEKKFSNGNRIASTALVEAIDPMVKASNIGVIDEEGNEVIPFENKSIRLVNDDIILVEKAQPVSESVIASINMKSDPSFATKLVSTPALIKEKLNSKMGDDGRYFFNDQFSEATVCDINGNNLVNDEYFSFIAMAGGKLYFANNTADTDITEYSILPPEVQGNVTPDNDSDAIDVKEVEISKDVVEDALNSMITDVSYLADNDNNTNEIAEDEENIEIPSIGVDDEEAIEASETVGEDTIDIDTLTDDIATPMVSEVPQPSDEENTAEIEDEAVEVVEEKETEEDENVSLDKSIDVEEKDLEEHEEEIKAAEEDVTLEEEIGDTEENAKEEEVVDNLESVNLDVEDEIDLNINFNDKDLDEEEIENVDSMTSVELDDEDFTDIDIFKDSILKADKIVSDDDVYYDDSNFIRRSVGTKKDTIMMDVAKSMTNLIRQNKEQRNTITKYQDRFEKLNATRRGMADKVKEQEEKLEVLTNKIRSMEATLAKLESRNQLLESKNRDQEKVISSQAREIDELRPQLAGKEELIRVLADAQLLLEQDSSYDYDYREGYYKNIA